MAGFNPGKEVFGNVTKFFIEMISFIPFLFIIVGLFDVWFPKEKVEKHVGQESGLKGIFLVIILALLQAGLLHRAFPVAYIRYKKGASIKNIFIYMGAFSSLKIPMLASKSAILACNLPWPTSPSGSSGATSLPKLKLKLKPSQRGERKCHREKHLDNPLLAFLRCLV